MTVTMLAPPPATLALRPYQHDAAEALLFAHLAHEAVAHGGRVLIVAHRDELLTQARDKLLLADPSADVGIVRAELDECDAQIVVASVQTLAQPHRLARVGRFSLVVIDEAHHAAAASYHAILESLGAFAPVGPLVLGVTATPGRGDGVGLDEIFEEIVYWMNILDGIRGGYLADLRAVSVTLDTDFSGVRSRGGDLADGELGDALLAADAPEHVAAAYREHADGRRALVFTPTVAVAASMAGALRGAGVPAAHVSGETPRDERASILARFRSGELRAVANAMLLTEGYDEPAADCIIVARPTKSASLYTQMIGRGTRLHPGKRDCLIVDVIGQAGRHDLVSTASLFGLSRRALAAQTVTEAVEARQAAQDAALRRERPDARLVARPVDLFKQRALHWVEADPTTFVLSVPGGRIVLRQHVGGWRATLTDRDGAREIGRDLPLPYAQGVAEDRARALGAEWLVDPDAPWRRRPASEKQLALLLRRRLRVSSDLTAGEASDLIASGRRAG